MRMARNVYSGSGSVVRSGSGRTVAPRVAEQRDATDRGGCTGVDAHGQDVREGMNFNLHLVLGYVAWGLCFGASRKVNNVLRKVPDQHIAAAINQ